MFLTQYCDNRLIATLKDMNDDTLFSLILYLYIYSVLLILGSLYYFRHNIIKVIISIIINLVEQIKGDLN